MEPNEIYYETYRPPLRQPYEPASRRDLAFAAVLLVFSVFFTDCLLWSKAGLGMAVCLVGAFAAFCLYLRKHWRGNSFYAISCGLCGVLLALSLVFTASSDLKALAVLGAVLLFAVFLEERMQLRSGKGLGTAIADLCVFLFAGSFGQIGRACYGIFSKADADGTTRRRSVGKVLLGIALALPLLLVIVPLLISSDAAFEGMLKKVDFTLLFRTFWTLWFGLSLALLLFAQLFTLPKRRRLKGEATYRKGLEPLLVGSFLGVILLVYCLYLFSQLAYFFDAFGGLLPSHYTFAQYARRGFFEMCAIVAINLVLVVLTVWLCRRQNGKLPRSIRVFALLLCLFSLLLVAAAMSKMLLYIDSYGLTRLRILTSVFMLFLTVVLICVALRMFREKVPCLKIAVLTAAICLLSLNFVDVDRVIARYNIHAYQSGTLQKLDMDTLSELSPSAVPQIAELLSDKDPAICTRAKQILHQHMINSYGMEAVTEGGKTQLDVSSYDWRAFTLPDYRARACLIENWEKIIP